MANGIVTIAAAQGVDATVAKLKNLLQAKKVKLFAVIDHSGEAESAGMHMPNTKLLIFGNPAAGTPIMLATPLAALDLPLKILVWEDADRRTWVSYNSTEYLQRRHELPDGLIAKIAVIGALASSAANPV